MNKKFEILNTAGFRDSVFFLYHFDNYDTFMHDFWTNIFTNYVSFAISKNNQTTV
jgi:hypothetical protein